MDFRSATIISRALVPSALFIPNLLSTVNAALSFRGTSTTRFLSTIQQNRATIQPIVHVISSAPGALQIFVVSSLLRFRLKTQLLATPLSLNSLKLRGALDVGKLDFDLPTWSVISVLAYVLIIQGPAAIWCHYASRYNEELHECLSCPSVQRRECRRLGDDVSAGI